MASQPLALEHLDCGLLLDYHGRTWAVSHFLGGLAFDRFWVLTQLEHALREGDMQG